MKVYPVEGRLIRHPATKRPIPSEGLEVPDHDAYWHRALNVKDLTLDPPPKTPVEKTEEPHVKVDAPAEEPLLLEAPIEDPAGEAPAEKE